MEQWKVRHNKSMFSLKRTIRGSGLYDYDGNEYQSVIIGSQEWLASNYIPIHYADGSIIENITDTAEWFADASGAWCYYDNDINNLGGYGRLYNQYAAKSPNGFVYLERGGVVEADWRLPSPDDYNALWTELGGSLTAGGKLKEAGTDYWDSPNTGATNSSGFGARAGGRRWAFVSGFYALRNWCLFWTSTNTYLASMWYATSSILMTAGDMRDGLSVRLVRDI